MGQIFPVLLGTLADDKQSDEVCSYSVNFNNKKIAKYNI